jgi:monothiol glutaredoxin
METQSQIREIVDSNRIVVFMKGSPDFPQCGFSMRAASILRALGQPFHHVDVLQDAEIRAGIKEFSKWPTIPQVYIDQKFLGGSDILMEMWEDGELEALFTPKA